MRTQEASAVSAHTIDTARRVEERVDLCTEMALHLETGEQVTSRLIDLTTRGCRLETDRALVAGAHVTLVGRATMTGGTVTWVSENKAGVEFGARLMPKAMRALSA